LVHLYPPISLQELQNEGSLIVSYYAGYANEPAVKAQFSKYGTIKELRSQTYEDVRVTILEYYDSRNENSAKLSLNGQKIQVTNIQIKLFAVKTLNYIDFFNNRTQFWPSSFTIQAHNRGI